MSLPEWRCGEPSFPAAFAPSSGGAPFIEATLRCSEPGPVEVMVRAAAAQGSVLGDVEATLVQFVDGRWTGLMRLPGTRLGTVAHEVIRWHWETNRGSITPNCTEHEIYTVLDRPGEPWDASGAEEGIVPWKEALDLACKWARGAEDTAGVMSRIAAELYAYGQATPPKFVYGANTYAERRIFKIGLFLESLATDNNPLDCADCATIVSTFANLVGCSSWQVVLDTPNGIPFRTKLVRAIGKRNAETFPFNQHETAWDIPDGELGRVWDCCLGEDGQNDPFLGVVFGTPDLPSNSYRSAAFSRETAQGLLLRRHLRRQLSF